MPTSITVQALFSSRRYFLFRLEPIVKFRPGFVPALNVELMGARANLFFHRERAAFANPFCRRL